MTIEDSPKIWNFTNKYERIDGKLYKQIDPTVTEYDIQDMECESTYEPAPIFEDVWPKVMEVTSDSSVDEEHPDYYGSDKWAER